MARRFGASWWGKAWIDALENRAQLDPNRLPRGRTYARKGSVLEVVIESGVVRASVQGSRRRPYKVELRLRTLSADEWSTVIDLIVAKAARAAALLDDELDPDLVAEGEAVGVGLLPGARELVPRCSCPDWADPCKHSAAVCYIVADELDADPFALLQLRGMGREQLLAEVRQRRSRTSVVAGAAGARAGGASGSGVPGADSGMRATDAWKRPLGSLPTVPPRRGFVVRSSLGLSDVPEDAPFSLEGLSMIVADAAQRAHQALSEGASLGLRRSLEDDTARLAAAALGTDRFDDLAGRVGETPRVLARRAIAWRVDGPAGLAALDEAAWTPPLSEMEAARDALLAAGESAESLRVKANRVTVDPTTQLRLARSGRWYRFVKRGGTWELDAGPSDEPDDLIDP